MRTWKVRIPTTGYETIEVQANGPDEAISKCLEECIDGECVVDDRDITRITVTEVDYHD